MKLKMARNSLFAVLLRSRWWISLAIGLVLGLVAAALVPAGYRAAGLLSGAPFLVIAAMSAWQGRHRPSPAQLARATQAVSGMGWPAFAQALESAFQREGYTVQRRQGQGGDFELARQGRRTVVAARRWKSAHIGLEPLRALQAARLATRVATSAAGEVPDALFIGLGALSEPARELARVEGIAVWQAPELARQLRGLLPGG